MTPYERVLKHRLKKAAAKKMTEHDELLQLRKENTLLKLQLKRDR